MPSIHVWKSIKKSAALGGFASAEDALPLWDMSKRELVEIVVRLGCLTSGYCDNPDAGVAEALKEYEELKRAGIL